MNTGPGPNGMGSEPLWEWPARSRTSYKQMTFFADLDSLSLPSGNLNDYLEG